MTIKTTPTYPEALQRLHRDASANIHKLNDSNKKRVKKHGVKSMITRLRSPLKQAVLNCRHHYLRPLCPMCTNTCLYH